MTDEVEPIDQPTDKPTAATEEPEVVSLPGVFVTLSDTDRVVTALEDVGGRVATLADKQETLTEELRQQRKSNHRMKIWQLITVVGLCLDFGLSYLYFSNQHKANEAIALNRDNAVVTCQSTNVARAEALGVWTKVLDLSANGKPDSAAIANIRTEVTLTYAPRDCSALEK
jgi:hypothetical protein